MEQVNINGYSLEPRKIKYVEGYVVLSFGRKPRDKYGKKLIDAATKTGTDAAEKLLLKECFKKLQKLEDI